MSYVFTLLLGILLSVRSKLCSDGEHVDGTWVRDVQITEKVFECCDSNHDLKASFSNPPGCNGSENLGIIYFQRGLPFTGRGCECDRRLGQTSQHEREMYVWKPKQCHLSEWNSTLFCQLLSNRTVLMVGDSTMEQTSVTLISMIRKTSTSCANQILFARSDYLIWERFGKEKTWIQNLDLHHPDILILNAGAWLKDEGDMETVLDSITTEIKRRKHASQRLPSLLWKSQSPGHRDCDKFQTPLTASIELAINRSNQVHKFNWHLHRAFDLQARKAIFSVNGSVLDVSPLYLRPDSHPGSNSTAGGDCLHYCIPGPLDLFSRLLLHELVVKT